MVGSHITLDWGNLIFPDHIPLEKMIILDRNTIIARDSNSEEESQLLTQADAIKAVLEKGYFTPNINQFLIYFKNIISAHQGKTKLFNGRREELPKKEVDEIYDNMNIGDRFDEDWIHTPEIKTRLDAYFVEKDNELFMRFNHRLNNGEITFEEVPIDYVKGACSSDNLFIGACYLTPDSANKFGMPTKFDKNLQKGEGNILFECPEDGRAAEYYVSPKVGPVINCGADPNLKSIGTLYCAEGILKK
ncbi:MAG: hypothetical protein PHT54_03630 [Candidatus Nanoarchaeia archaeon]|nr:hypothetical protein [Candidatus Nanoarchaeia archaeon]